MTGTRAPRVVVLAVHPPRIAATRLRASQHVPYWQAAGLHVVEWSFLRERDLDDWYGSSQLRRVIVLLRALLRLPLLVGQVRSASLVLVQREALPLGPPVVELLAARACPLVWDVDDAVWEAFDSPTAGRVPQWLRATGGKYERLCRRADAVWAGSEVLARWCRQHSERVELVPTVIPVAAERAEPTRARTVGWVGSHSTGPFLQAVLPAVAEVSPPPEVLVVGAAVTAPARLSTEIRRWSQEAEDSALASTRVGLYPVDRAHALAEGKCGLKAILYMSHGIPCVVTPTTTNAALVRDGIEGLHADAPDEWTSAVQHLLDDDDLHQRMSAAAHARAREHFSLEAWGPRLASRLRALTEGQ